MGLGSSLQFVQIWLVAKSKGTRIEEFRSGTCFA